ncbi:hypothetical protein BDW22DRAFT_1188165 [Trametopsis cervina]|nr:hypothetical protein BDW22DRAFT_1188165 [Trametopsis cervina]
MESASDVVCELSTETIDDRESVETVFAFGLRGERGGRGGDAGGGEEVEVLDPGRSSTSKSDGTPATRPERGKSVVWLEAIISQRRFDVAMCYEERRVIFEHKASTTAIYLKRAANVHVSVSESDTDEGPRCWARTSENPASLISLLCRLSAPARESLACVPCAHLSTPN